MRWNHCRHWRDIGSDDKPVAQAQMFCRITRSDPRAGGDYFLYDYFLMNLRGRPVWRSPVEVLDGRFELHGCDPDKTYSVHFLDNVSQMGTIVELAAKEAGTKPVTVRLRPCGSAATQFFDPDGKPVAGNPAWLTLVVSPGGSPFDPKAVKEESLLADLFFVGNLTSDKEGRMTIRNLIPGANYRLVWFEQDGTRQKGFKTESGGDAGDSKNNHQQPPTKALNPSKPA